MAEKAPPSLTAVAVSSLILGLLAGYFIGQGSSIGVFGGSGGSKQAKTSWPNSYDVKVHADSSDDQADDEDEADEDGEDGDGKELKDFKDSSEDVKLVLGVRTDLGMGKGKIAAQCSHATLACYKYLLNHVTSAPMLKRWEQGGQPKIAVQVKSEEELETLQAQAISLGLCARIIHDAGRTQIAAGSATVLGILGPKSVVDQVTGHLKLL
ncbi:PTH2 family peptidyl-tRNA hydrolase [Cladophialophora yegresii CBS 114405]|uniref:peptidyl-tRNA hydrolase n=1 Tax=Cladophialophora yegresii CBS 114405 TaxID=1182544 RepID=W9VGN5_9EURO|nr:PTH2 family peptidyl-tRNA hydrolase [Cladophialophora yegresii CBS 114405]EXJ54648.1 PTH2 family peptidyl-tRNA hydrolase [Cladophialophora yegresii CBS 114405]